MPLHLAARPTARSVLMRSALVAAGIAGVAALAACAPPPPAPVPATAAAASPASPAAPVAPPTFVNRVWRVAASSAVAEGQLYVFLSEGTLVITSATGTPLLGRWSRAGAGLTMVEEGRSYAVDIVSLTAAAFHIRSHNPGQPVDIQLVPADDPDAPAAARP